MAGAAHRLMTLTICRISCPPQLGRRMVVASHWMLGLIRAGALRVMCLRSLLSYSFPACPVEELGVRASNFRKAHLASKALGRRYTSKIPGTVKNGGP